MAWLENSHLCSVDVPAVIYEGSCLGVHTDAGN